MQITFFSNVIQIPTFLAKILGVYKITIKNHNRKTVQLSFLVMENIRYNKKFAKIFDLKGSKRNRFVNDVSQSVMLDTNLTLGFLFFFLSF